MYMKHIYNWFFFKDDTCVKTKKTYHTTQSIYYETTSTIFSNDEGTKHNVHDRIEHSRYYTYNLIGISIFLSLHKNIFFKLCLLLRYLINMICFIFFVFIYYYFFFLQPKHNYNSASNNSSNTDCVGLPCGSNLLQAS